MTVCGLAIAGGVAFAGCADVKAGPKADAEFDRMDTDHDGRISREEHAAGAKWMFDTMDANKDGRVTAAEMDAAHQKVTGHGARPTDMAAADKIKAVDRDGDGVLSAEEHAAGSKAMFEAMDGNADGFVSQAELAAGHAKMMPKASH